MNISRGFFAIGICHNKTKANLGTLWRSANIAGASLIFTVGNRYNAQSSDTLKTPRHIPMMHFKTVKDLIEHLPWSTPLVGVELSDEAIDIKTYKHPQRAAYLLGAEDHGLTKDEMSYCHQLIKLPGDRSMNVAVAGSIVMFDRNQKAA